MATKQSTIMTFRMADWRLRQLLEMADGYDLNYSDTIRKALDDLYIKFFRTPKEQQQW